MTEGGRAGADQLRRLLDAVLGVGRELSLPVVLHRIIETAVDLVDASYGALGVLDHDRQRLAEFVVVGVDDDQVAAIGALPDGHGILGVLIVDPRPLRLPDITQHPESFGIPPNHPPMTTFLGVPVFVGGEVFGNLYLTDKAGGELFTDVDEELAVAFAAAAGVAIDNARLHARVREVDVLTDRERIARDLHDTVIQRLFATGLSLQGAARLAERPEVQQRLQQAVEDLDITVRQVRSAIFELHAPPVPGRSVRRQLLAIGHEMAAPLGFEPMFRFEGAVDSLVGEEVGDQLLIVTREALANVARHACATRVEVVVAVAAERLSLTVTDDGKGPGSTTGGRGVDNMRARAAALDGAASIAAAEHGGTVVRWQVPLT